MPCCIIQGSGGHRQRELANFVTAIINICDLAGCMRDKSHSGSCCFNENVLFLLVLLYFGEATLMRQALVTSGMIEVCQTTIHMTIHPYVQA